MRSSTPHLMLALCTMAVQAAPISPAPKTPDMLTVMARGEVEARDTLDANNLDINDYSRRSTSGFPEANHEMEAQPNVRRSIGGYSYPAGSNAVDKRDENQSNAPGVPGNDFMSDSDADSDFNSDSASDSGSDFGSDSEDENLGPREVKSFTRMEARDAPPSPTFPNDDGFSDDMFDADADDEFDGFEDGNLDNLDVEAQHAEIKRSIDELLRQDYALERRDEAPTAAPEDGFDAQSFDSDSDFNSASDSDFDSDFDSDEEEFEQNSASDVPGPNGLNASAEEQQKQSLKLDAEGGDIEGGDAKAKVEAQVMPKEGEDRKLEMI